MLGPFSATPIIARLAALPQLAIVGGASDLRAAQETPPSRTPAAYVVCSETASPPAGYSGALVQTVTVAIAVVLWVSHAQAPARGAKKRIAADDVAAVIREALLGWRPAADVDHLELAGGRDDAAPGAQLVTQQIFRTRYSLRVIHHT